MRAEAHHVADMRAEYNLDYSKATRGRYYRRLLKEGANVVVLDPDVARAFRSSTAVNEALRSLIASQTRRQPAARSKRKAPRARSRRPLTTSR